MDCNLHFQMLLLGGSGAEISYYAGGQSIALHAIPEAANPEITASPGVIERNNGVSFVIRTIDLSPLTRVPARGDRIGYSGGTYEVVEPFYSRLDPAGNLLRIYTVEVE